LGAQPGFVTVGEACFVWQWGVIEDRQCSCGVPFSSCLFWREVVNLAPGIFEAQLAQEYASYFSSVLLVSRRTPWLWTKKGRSRILNGAPAGYLKDLSRLYCAIRTVSGANVIVDGSKLATYDYLLRFVPGLDVTTVHLVRDPRAVAFSWHREKKIGELGSDGPRYMLQRRTLESSVDWDLQNLSVNKASAVSGDRALRLRYEDFVTRPAEVTQELVGVMGEAFVGDNPSAKGDVILSGQHVFGNPNRFDSGRLSIHLDDEWQTAMSLTSQVLVTSITAPLLARYRYPIMLRRATAKILS
jgi:hypothetical protein